MSLIDHLHFKRHLLVSFVIYRANLSGVVFCSVASRYKMLSYRKETALHGAL